MQDATGSCQRELHLGVGGRGQGKAWKGPGEDNRRGGREGHVVPDGLIWLLDEDWTPYVKNCTELKKYPGKSGSIDCAVWVR